MNGDSHEGCQERKPNYIYCSCSHMLLLYGLPLLLSHDEEDSIMRRTVEHLEVRKQRGKIGQIEGEREKAQQIIPRKS